MMITAFTESIAHRACLPLLATLLGVAAGMQVMGDATSRHPAPPEPAEPTPAAHRAGTDLDPRLQGMFDRHAALSATGTVRLMAGAGSPSPGPAR